MAGTPFAKKRWLPIEANLDVMNRIETSRPSTEDIRIRAELDRLKEVVSIESLNRAKIIKRKKAAPSAPRSISTPRDYYPLNGRLWNRRALPFHFLFEFACGYALFNAHGANEVEMNFESAEKYINSSDQVFTLEAFHLFSSPVDALVQMNAISEATVTEQLKNFLMDNLPKPIDGKPSCCVAVSQALLSANIGITVGMPNISGDVIFNVMRGLRMKIDKFIGLKPGYLEKAQLNLARLYSRQRCTTANNESSLAVSSSSLQEVVVVPHRFEGVFIAKGKEDFICTKNLVPGEALYGEELISVQNEEYRVWNPLRSKLAAAILCGVTNIWVKPGSRVLYLGDKCGITVSHLSDLVGSDGLVYAVGLSDVVVNMMEKRSNVVTIFEKCHCYWKYRMVVGMVDVIFADIVYPDQVNEIFTNARSHLRAGGHYMISTRTNNIDSTSQCKDPFVELYPLIRREFKPLEVVMLEPIEREYAMAVGGFRMLEA